MSDKKYPYKIIYDIKKDIWNWYYGAKYSGNTEQLDGEDLRVAQVVQKLNKREAEKILRPFLRSKWLDSNSELNAFIRIAEKEFEEKYAAACEVLAKITRKPFIAGEFTFYVTSFPRMVVFYDTRVVFMYAKINKKLWGMPIDGFLHEGLHFIFDKYWRNNKKSPVTKLSEDDFFELKEALTVILDEELGPIITLPDVSYPEFQELRNELHGEWCRHHNFEQLVEYGVKTFSQKTTL